MLTITVLHMPSMIYVSVCTSNEWKRIKIHCTDFSNYLKLRTNHHQKLVYVHINAKGSNSSVSVCFFSCCFFFSCFAVILFLFCSVQFIKSAKTQNKKTKIAHPKCGELVFYRREKLLDETREREREKEKIYGIRIGCASAAVTYLCCVSARKIETKH